MNKTVHLLVLHGLVVGLLSAWQLTHCLSCIFFLQGLCHPCQEKVSLCTLKSEWTWVNPLRFLRSTKPVEARFTFQSPANFVFCLFLFVCLFCFSISSRASQLTWGWGRGRTGGWGERHWVGQIIMGTEKRTGTKICDFSQDSPSVTFRSLPPLFHGQSHK